MRFVASREHRSAYGSKPENDRLENLHHQLHIHTNNLGIIDAVNGRRADVTVVQRKKHSSVENVTVQLLDVPIHTVCYGDFFLDAKVKVGDECRIHYCEREIETHLTQGGINDDKIARNHSLADAYIVPTCMTDGADFSDKIGLLKTICDLATIVGEFATLEAQPTVADDIAALKLKIEALI